jgi:hypothetical protein
MLDGTPVEDVDTKLESWIAAGCGQHPSCRRKTARMRRVSDRPPTQGSSSRGPGQLGAGTIQQMIRRARRVTSASRNDNTRIHSIASRRASAHQLKRIHRGTASGISVCTPSVPACIATAEASCVGDGTCASAAVSWPVCRRGSRRHSAADSDAVQFGKSNSERLCAMPPGGARVAYKDDEKSRLPRVCGLVKL